MQTPCRGEACLTYFSSCIIIRSDEILEFITKVIMIPYNHFLNRIYSYSNKFTKNRFTIHFIGKARIFCLVYFKRTMSGVR